MIVSRIEGEPNTEGVLRLKTDSGTWTVPVIFSKNKSNRRLVVAQTDYANEDYDIEPGFDLRYMLNEACREFLEEERA